MKKLIILLVMVLSPLWVFAATETPDPQIHNVGIFALAVFVAVIGTYFHFLKVYGRGGGTSSFYNHWFTNIGSSFGTLSGIVVGFTGIIKAGGFSGMSDDMLWGALTSLNVFNLAPFATLYGAIMMWSYGSDSMAGNSGSIPPSVAEEPASLTPTGSDAATAGGNTAATTE
jgi:hypothetical protein